MSEHVFPEGEARCAKCGTLKEQYDRAPHLSPCPYTTAPDSSAILRPEPAERRYAVNDRDTIAARLAELKTEREAAWNTVEEETG
jgi:hypothetical protein